MFDLLEGCRFRGGRTLGESSRELLAAAFLSTDMHDDPIRNYVRQAKTA